MEPLRTAVASVAQHLQPATLVILESTDAILKLRAEPELRRQMGANGHKVALREVRLESPLGGVRAHSWMESPSACSPAEGAALDDGRHVDS
jgi:hypothetical protein